MMKNTQKMALLGATVLAVGSVSTACSGGDDDDDDGSSGQPVISQGDGGAADFTTCTAIGSSAATISLKVFVGKQGLDTSADPAATPGSIVSVFDPLTGNTSGASAPTAADGTTIVPSVPKSSLVAFKVTHATDGATTFVDGYDYRVTPAVSDSSGTAYFNTRIIPTSVRNAIAAILGPPVANLAGLTSFAGSVTDCSGEPIVGATLHYAGAEPNRCSSSAALPCVAYSTDTGEDYSDDGGQVFLLGLPGSGQLTVNVMGVLTEDAAPVQIGTITVRGVADAIVLAPIPAQNAP